MAESTSPASELDTNYCGSAESGQAPLFPPRPILLRMLDESRNPYQTGDRIDPSKIVMAPSHNMQETISVDQANILQSQHGRACETSTTNYHDLTCGHTVMTSTSFPAPYDVKSPCASNCQRFQPTTHCTLVPFVCPVCLETLIRRNFIKTWKEFMAAGYAPDPDPSRNVKKWLSSSIRQLSKVGLRIVQGTSGLFLLGAENEFAHINFVPSVVSDKYGRWSFQGRQRKRSRSRSPVRTANVDRASRKVSKDRARSRGRASAREYRARSPIRTLKTFDLDGLVEYFGDARIGLQDDEEVDSLLQGVSNL